MKMLLTLFEAICEIRDQNFIPANSDSELCDELRNAKFQTVMNSVHSKAQGQREEIARRITMVLGNNYHVTAEWTPYHLVS